MKTIRFLKKNTVFCIAALAAILTIFFVPPDEAYLDYIDWKTIVCLFLTLAVVCALRNIKFFTILARRLVMLAGNLRSLFLLLIVITFLGSMIIANDMALITFLPLGYFALQVTKQEKYMAYLFVLQNISANLRDISCFRVQRALQKEPSSPRFPRLRENPQVTRAAPLCHICR